MKPTVEIKCSKCGLLITMTAEQARMDRKIGKHGIPYYTVTVRCPHCSEMSSVPGNKEINELLLDRVRNYRFDS